MTYMHHLPPPVPWLDNVHPNSFHTVSRATLQFPDCITCSPPVPRLYHVLPSSSQTVSRATLQFPDCITCYPPVPRLYHVLPSSSQTVSRATLQFPDCITCYPPVPKFITPPHIPFGDTWKGKLSLFSPFVTFIDFTLSTEISA